MKSPSNTERRDKLFAAIATNLQYAGLSEEMAQNHVDIIKGDFQLLLLSIKKEVEGRKFEGALDKVDEGQVFGLGYNLAIYVALKIISSYIE